eukprot:282460-Rhodomonas_salina.3
MVPFTAAELGCLGIASLAALAAVLPRTHQVDDGSPHVNMDSFTDVKFRHMFRSMSPPSASSPFPLYSSADVSVLCRFRRPHVWELLSILELLDGAGHPKLLLVGKPGRYSLIHANTALLITLCRLSRFR